MKNVKIGQKLLVREKRHQDAKKVSGSAKLTYQAGDKSIALTSSSLEWWVSDQFSYFDAFFKSEELGEAEFVLTIIADVKIEIGEHKLSPQYDPQPFGYIAGFGEVTAEGDYDVTLGKGWVAFETSVPGTVRSFFKYNEGAENTAVTIKDVEIQPLVSPNH